MRAQKRAELRGRRPKASKFENAELASVVQAKLCLKWSPEQISDHLDATFPDRVEMQVCPETIYQALYVQGRGHLRADLHQHLRTGRAVRRPRRSTAKGSPGHRSGTRCAPSTGRREHHRHRGRSPPAGPQGSGRFG